MHNEDILLDAASEVSLMATVSCSLFPKYHWSNVVVQLSVKFALGITDGSSMGECAVDAELPCRLKMDLGLLMGEDH